MEKCKNNTSKNDHEGMIGLHTHTLFSDGALLPSELVRRAAAKGYSALAITDHVDSSNIDFVLPRIMKVCKVLNKSWSIFAIPGVEITHVPVQEIGPLVKFARKHGAKVVVVHGETVSEPVIKGTNRAAILAGCDILAHPGIIETEDVELAAKRGVYLEVTTRKSHSSPNKRLIKLAEYAGAKLVINTDAHDCDDLIVYKEAIRFLKSLGMKQGDIKNIFNNMKEIVSRAC